MQIMSTKNNNKQEIIKNDKIYYAGTRDINSVDSFGDKFEKCDIIVIITFSLLNCVRKIKEQRIKDMEKYKNGKYIYNECMNSCCGNPPASWRR